MLTVIDSGSRKSVSAVGENAPSDPATAVAVTTA